MWNPKEILLSASKELLPKSLHINHGDGKEAEAVQPLLQELSGKVEK